MNVKCNYCGAMVEETNTTCPQCGAPIEGVNRVASEQPKTIEELQAWYTAHNLPPEEVTRFFIGKNIQEPKAFGIYKTAAGDCVVYKNKANGERAIRYKGADETYAVNELYQRLKTEIANQKATQPVSGYQPRQAAAALDPDALKKKKKRKRIGCGCLTILLIFFLIGIFLMPESTPRGYYKYDNTEYYHQGDDWYKYDAANDTWSLTESMSDKITADNASDYSFSDHQGTSFESTSYYKEWSYSSSDDNDWDNSSSWSSSDSWSSSSTDWDDDW